MIAESLHDRGAKRLSGTSRRSVWSRLLPALALCAVAAWAAPAGAETFRDEFNSQSYANNDGTRTWSTDWIETGDNPGRPDHGDIQIEHDVSDYQLRIRDDGNAIEREADLSGYTSAILSFRYRRESLDDADEYLAVEVSGDGGGSWTELARLAGPADDAGYSSFSWDISPFISADTRIRFRTPDGRMRNDDQIWLDDVQIEATSTQTGGCAGVVPVASESATSYDDHLSLQVPDEAEPGDLLVAQVAVGFGLLEGATITPPGGWTEIRSDVAFGLLGLTATTQGVYYRVVDGSEPNTYEWTYRTFLAGNPAAGAITLFRGVDVGEPIDAHAGGTGDGATITAPSVTTSVDGAYLLGLFASDSGDSDVAPATPLDTLYQAGRSDIAIAAGGQTQATAGATGSRSASAADGRNIGQLVALRPAACVAAIDHIRIEHNGGGLTCAPTTLTLRACANADCSALYTGGVTGTLTAAGTPTVNWSGGAGFSIGESGWTTKQVQVTTPGIVAWGAQSVSPAPVGPADCYVGATPSCDFTSTQAGFLFDVPDHTAAVTQSVAVSAVRQDDETQTCVPAFANVTKSVNFACSYANPASGTLPVSLQGVELACGGAGGAVALDFDADGVATAQLTYADVGQIGLTASYTGTGGLEAGLVMTGADLFVTKPDHFSLESVVCADATVNPEAADADGARFCRAGQDFEVTVASRNAHGGITPNYGREDPAESVALSGALIAPSGGANPPLSGAFGAFGRDCAGGNAAAGTACGRFSWGEVGIIRLTPSVGDADYLGAGDVVGTQSGNIGRFYPASFQITHTHAGVCGAGGGFTYAGQAGAKAGQPFMVTGSVTALNADGAITTNYTGAFAKLTAGDIGAEPRESGGAAAGALSWEVDTLTVSGGVGSFVEDDARYAFTDEGPPQDMHLRITVTDADGVTGSEEDAGKSVEYRFGRLRLGNAYGPELFDLPVPMQAEYYAAGGFYVLNTDDDCTELTTGGGLELSVDGGAGWVSGDTAVALGAGSTSAAIAHRPLAGGEAGLSFSAPGAGNTGDVDLRTRLGAGHPWLLYDWDGDGAHQEEARGRVSFGLYSGSRGQIYIREQY